MPIYEYECRSCGHIFDALQKIAEQPLNDCPECGKPGLQKLLSAPAFQVKGEAGAASAPRARTGHNLDSAHGHSHDHGNSHSHSHGGHTHSHGPGCGHRH
jgi:putative FmdB family regulatory protein